MWLANETMRKYQASNDDTKRMHSAIMNMYRSPSCGLPLTFWGDAVQDAAYVTERSLANVNSAKISTLQLKTKKYPLFVRLYFWYSLYVHFPEMSNFNEILYDTKCYRKQSVYEINWKIKTGSG